METAQQLLASRQSLLLVLAGEEALRDPGLRTRTQLLFPERALLEPGPEEPLDGLVHGVSVDDP